MSKLEHAGDSRTVSPETATAPAARTAASMVAALVIGEEGGLFWVLAVVGLFVIVLWRGISIAKAEREYFGSLLALGLTASIALQAVINMGVTVSLLPTTGLTLPFLSYGGTAMVVNLAFIGVLMNIWASRQK